MAERIIYIQQNLTLSKTSTLSCLRHTLSILCLSSNKVSFLTCSLRQEITSFLWKGYPKTICLHWTLHKITVQTFLLERNVEMIQTLSYLFFLFLQYFATDRLQASLNLWSNLKFFIEIWKKMNNIQFKHSFKWPNRKK